MQETGKINQSCDKVLSIQLQLGGLSFYCNTDGRYAFRQIKEESGIPDEIKREVASDSYDTANFYHNSMDYIVMPLSLFEGDMCEAYLQTKDITADNQQMIVSCMVDDYVYISLIHKTIHECLTANFKTVNILPLLVKVINYGAGYDVDMISLVVGDSILHIAYYENKTLKFCESLPIQSDSDIDFFIDSLMKKYKPRADVKVISLYETGRYTLNKALLSKYGIIRITKDNYFAI